MDGFINGEIAKRKGRDLARLEFEKLEDPLKPIWDVKDLAEQQSYGFETQFILGYNEERSALEKVWKRAYDRGYESGEIDMWDRVQDESFDPMDD